VRRRSMLTGWGFHMSWVLGPFDHGRLQNMKTNEDTFGHDITPLTFPKQVQLF